MPNPLLVGARKKPFAQEREHVVEGSVNSSCHTLSQNCDMSSFLTGHRLSVMYCEFVSVQATELPPPKSDAVPKLCCRWSTVPSPLSVGLGQRDMHT